MHYFDSGDNLIGNSGWFPLDKQPQWVAVNQVVARVVVEHDTVNAFANDSKGEPFAKWYSIDHMVFSGGSSVASVKSESDLALTQNYPNPFNPSTVIRFNLPSDDRIELAIYNILGQKVRVLAEGEYGVGPHEVEWYGENDLGQKVSAGVYFYRLVTSSANVSKKMIMVK